MITCEHCKEGKLLRAGTYISQKGAKLVTFKCDHCSIQHSVAVDSAVISNPPSPQIIEPEYIPTWRVRATKLRDNSRWRVREPVRTGAIRLPRYGDDK